MTTQSSNIITFHTKHKVTQDTGEGKHKLEILKWEILLLDFQSETIQRIFERSPAYYAGIFIKTFKTINSTYTSECFPETEIVYKIQPFF